MGIQTSIFERLKIQARKLKAETFALYLAYRDPRTPWYAKAWAALVIAYAFSPIDLIPDFVPLLGYLDDLILVPGGIALALRLIPPEVMVEARQKAREMHDKPVNWLAGALILLLWLGMAALAIAWLARWLKPD